MADDTEPTTKFEKDTTSGSNPGEPNNGNFQLGLTPGELNSPGAKAEARPSARANPAAGPTGG